MTIVLALAAGPHRPRGGSPLDLVALRALDARDHHAAGRTGPRSPIPDDGSVVRRRERGWRRLAGRASWPSSPLASAPSALELQCSHPSRPSPPRSPSPPTPGSAVSVSPIHHRQVNERWLDQFRPWVYGAGFGWQIGAGLATYIKTCAVYLMIVLAALCGQPRRPRSSSASSSASSADWPCSSADTSRAQLRSPTSIDASWRPTRYALAAIVALRGRRGFDVLVARLAMARRGASPASSASLLSSGHCVGVGEPPLALPHSPTHSVTAGDRTGTAVLP